MRAFRVGARIYLRPLESADAEVMVTWVNDPDVTRTLYQHRPTSIQSEREFIDRVSRSDHDVVLGIMTRADDRFIGVTGLHAIDFKNRKAVFGISIGEKGEWDRGYGSEATALMVEYAFDTLNLNRVTLQVYGHNRRGIKVYERAGFQREGVLRQDNFVEGQYHDTLTMGILREEWTKPGDGRPTSSPKRRRRSKSGV
jgi:RimJ/RimL family protein N-acetyltransferase